MNPLSPSRLADAVLSTVSDAIVAADKDGIIRFWNPGAERIFGYTSADAVGQSLDIIIPQGQRQRHWQGYRQVMATGESRYGRGDVKRTSVPTLSMSRMFSWQDASSFSSLMPGPPRPCPPRVLSRLAA